MACLGVRAPLERTDAARAATRDSAELVSKRPHSGPAMVSSTRFLPAACQPGRAHHGFLLMVAASAALQLMYRWRMCCLCKHCLSVRMRRHLLHACTMLAKAQK